VHYDKCAKQNKKFSDFPDDGADVWRPHTDGHRTHADIETTQKLPETIDPKVRRMTLISDGTYHELEVHFRNRLELVCGSRSRVLSL
jgi:hypothetical protein